MSKRNNLISLMYLACLNVYEKEKKNLQSSQYNKCNCLFKTIMIVSPRHLIAFFFLPELSTFMTKQLVSFVSHSFYI